MKPIVWQSRQSFHAAFPQSGIGLNDSATFSTRQLARAGQIISCVNLSFIQGCKFEKAALS